MKKIVNYVKGNEWMLLSMLLTVVCVFLCNPGMLMANATVVPSGTTTVSEGAAGVESQVPGAPETVSSLADATGGIDAGKLVEPDIDEQIFKIGTDETVLLDMVLKSRKVQVASPEVDHYIIDEQKPSAKTTSAYTGARSVQAVIPVAASDQNYFQAYGTVECVGVNGYTEDGQTAVPGKNLMLFIVGRDATTNNPIVRAVNGPKTNATDAVCNVPTIPVDTELIFLSNALYETQKEVEPDMIVPSPKRIYLQKRGVNQIVSDYFDAQRKRIPFNDATIAEAIVKNWKRKCNRTFWVGQKSKFMVSTPKVGNQFVYTTEGIRWQIKRQFDHSASQWTFEEFLALTKMVFTGMDTPSSATMLAGKNLVENIQKIDWSKHPQIQILNGNVFGIKVTTIHTVFGDLNIKHEPGLDYIGFSNSAAILGDNRLVRYTYKSETSTSEQIEGEEAKRRSVIVWDGVGLKGYCHIWVNGEDGASDIPGTIKISTWDNATTAPASPTLNEVYYLMQACTGISATSKAGDMWQWNGTAWAKYTGSLYIAES